MGNHPPVISFILPNLGAGGAERVMITIANHLDRQKFKPLIIVFDKSGPLIDLIADDIELIDLQARKIRYGSRSYIKAIHAYKPAIIISTMAHLNFLVLLLKIFTPRTPIVVREAITPSYFSDSKIKGFILNAGYCVLYPMAARIISPTRITFDEMPKMLKRHQHKFIRHFNPVNVDTMRKDKNQIQRKDLADDYQTLFVAAGRLVHQKGFDRLIESLKSWAGHDHWRLVILGDGPNHQALTDQIERLGLDQITLKGFEAKPWQYYMMADAFLLPSRHEGLPNVALEALAMGTAVIAMESAGGISEIAHESTTGSVQIAQTMYEFLGLMQKVKPLNKTEPHISLLPECFSLPEIVRGYEQTFKDILEKS